jgi:hypothetical protein
MPSSTRNTPINSTAIERMQSAAEFFASEEGMRRQSEREGIPARRWDRGQYMDFAERYGDYVCDYEKSVSRSGMAIFDANSTECIKIPKGRKL